MAAIEQTSMSPAGSDDATALRAIVASYEAVQALHVGAKLDLADLVVRRTTSGRELAALTGSNPGSG